MAALRPATPALSSCAGELRARVGLKRIVVAGMLCLLVGRNAPANDLHLGQGCMPFVRKDKRDEGHWDYAIVL